jgi:hypothetical protein
MAACATLGTGCPFLHDRCRVAADKHAGRLHDVQGSADEARSIWLMMPVRWLTRRPRTQCRAGKSSLIGCFGGDELYGRSGDSFSDRFSVAEIVLLPFAV